MSRYNEVMSTISRIERLCSPSQFILGEYYQELFIDHEINEITNNVGSLLLFGVDLRVFNTPIRYSDNKYEFDFEL